MKNKIEAKMVAHSVNTKGDEIATMELIFPRMILSELNTHRVFSKNSASSRAIPFIKMKEMVMNDPFIPIAWQKDHKGMQGTEYYTEDDIYFPNGKSCKENGYNNMVHFHTENWDEARLLAVSQASILNTAGVTKQLCNRLLEPFMWHKVLLTATEFENFFNLRCPQYHYDLEDIYFKSRKDWLAYYKLNCIGNPDSNFDLDEMDWYNINKSQAEIHIQALAEAMWDAMNESTPKQLKAGEWHIPYGDEINLKRNSFYSNLQIATARCARLSYQTFGDNPKIDYEADIRLHDSLIGPPFHASPFEHCARAMDVNEHADFTRTYELLDDEHDMMGSRRVEQGWCNNFKGFIQYRYLIENDLEIE